VVGEAASRTRARAHDVTRSAAADETSTAEQRLAVFIDKFAPDVAALIRAARRKMRQRLPRAIELVYDNYNFFVIGYGPNERPSDAIFSIAAQAKGVALCFLQGARLPDPQKLLRGSGNVVRNIRLESAATLDQPAVEALIRAALERAKTPMDPRGEPRLIIRSVSAKQRPRQKAVAVRTTVTRAKPPSRARPRGRRSLGRVPRLSPGVAPENIVARSPFGPRACRRSFSRGRTCSHLAAACSDF
jgi:hypothetical protein